MLVSNKWKSERESRLSFLKAKIIEENRKLMNETLKRYFGDELSDKIISQKGELEGENRWVSILFNDISDYSTITENMAPEVALEFLNEYFSEMHKVIREFHGQILNYIGDYMSIQGLNWCLENAENCDMPSEVAILFLLSNPIPKIKS